MFVLQEIVKRNVPDERLRESVGEALGAVTFTYSRGEGQESDKVRSQPPKLYIRYRPSGSEFDEISKKK